MRGFLKAVSLSLVGLLTVGLSACGGDSNGAAFVVRIDVTPATASVAKGESLPLQAVATYSDNTTADITAQAIWTTSDPNVAAVGNSGASKGVVTGILQSEQPVTINAEFDAVLGSATVTVGQSAAVRIDISPIATTIAKGTTQQLQAVIAYSDGSTQNITTQATWTSGAPTVASVDDSAGNKGRVTGLTQRAAPVAISAAFNGLTGTSSVTVGAPLPVRVEVTPAMLSLPNGTSQQLTATAVYTDNSTQDVSDQSSWTSAAPATVSVDDGDDKGLVTAQALTAEPVTITATFGSFSDTADVTVTAAVLDEIQITPSDVEVPSGLTRQFSATAIFTDGSSQSVTSSATWSTSDAAVATVGNDVADKGLLTGVAASEEPVTLSATVGAVSGTTSVTITSGVVQQIDVQPATASVPRLGFKTRFTAIGTLSDGNTVDLTSQATWTSSAAVNVATISNTGSDRGVATSGDTAGTSQIRAALGGITSAPATLTVTAAALQSIELQADLDAAPETELSLSLGRTVDLRAVGVFSTTSGGTSTTSRQDITQSVTWSSCVASPDVVPCDETDDIATVSNAAATKGRVVTQSPGSAVIGASITVTDGTTSTTRISSLALTVTGASPVSLLVSPAAQTVARTFRTPFTAVGTFSDGSTDDVTAEVTWVTANSNIATVSNEPGEVGVAKGGAAGSTVITAKWPGTTIEDGSALTVTNATLNGITVTPANSTIRQGEVQGFVATGAFSDETSLDITRFNDVQWLSSNASVARFGAPAQANEATGVAQGGPVNVTATKTVGGVPVNGTTALTVAGYALSNVVIVPQSAQGCAAAAAAVELVPAGFARRFFACAVYFNGTIVNVTANAQWATEAASVVTVSNTGATKGRAAAVGAEGEQGIIRASFTDDGITRVGTYTVAVIDGDIESITVSADPALTGPLAAGSVVNFTAVADLSDGSTNVNITESAVWTSSETSVATVSSTDGTRGRATVLAADDEDPAPPTETDITAGAGGVTSAAVTIERAAAP
jgi:uncharacterized protein YjdB